MDTDENNSDQIDRNLEEITKRIDQLVEREVENPQFLLEELSTLITRVGVTKHDLSRLLDLIFDLRSPAYLKSPQKRFIIKNLLIPTGKYKLSKNIAYRIISSIGVPQIYYKNGKELKLKKLSTSIQTLLLEWLICSFHLFGSKVFNSLSMLTMLVNYLPYEFLRPYVANLIFLSVLNNTRMCKTYSMRESTHNIPPFKPWHFQFVLDLYYKFPMDEHIKSLLVLFKSLNTKIDFKKYSKDGTYDLNDLGVLNPKIFVYPNFNYLDKIKDIQAINSSPSDEIQRHQERMISDNLRHYENFSSSIKKRKKYRSSQTAPEISDLDMIEFGNSSSKHRYVSINDIHSFESLIGNFANIRHINISALFNPQKFGNVRFISDKFKKIYFILHCLSSDSEQRDRAIRKLDYYVRLSILDNNLSIRDLDTLCDKVADFFSFTSGKLFLPLIKDFLCFNFDSPIDDDEHIHKYENLTQRLKFLKYFPVTECNLFEESVIKNILTILEEKQHISGKRSRRELTFATFINELASLFSNWYSNYALSTSEIEVKEKVFGCINKILPIIYKFFVEKFTESSLVLKILLLRLLRFVQSIDPHNLNEFVDASTIVLPYRLLYPFILSNNPLIVSETCGYLAFCKAYKFKDSDVSYKSLQNSYVMDTLNFLWRNKSFKYEDSSTAFSNAMLLDPDFLTKLSKLNIFSFSDFLSLDSVGNIFHNPCWSFVATQIVRDLEDDAENITVRHAGPITEESLSQLIRDPTVEWLPTNYDELRLQVLRSLDNLGYTGLCDLLFSSLKTLMNKRR